MVCFMENPSMDENWGYPHVWKPPYIEDCYKSIMRMQHNEKIEGFEHCSLRLQMRSDVC